MLVTNLHFWYETVGSGPGGGGESDWAPWTMDWDLPPCTAYAFSNLGSYASRQGGQAGASTGILSYITQDPRTGIPSQPIVLSKPPSAYVPKSPFGPGFGDLYEGLVPCGDHNVIIITWAYNCFADDWLNAWVSFTVFTFE